MKLALTSLALSALVSAGGMPAASVSGAAGVDNVQANLFRCKVAGGIAVSYSATSILGQPELSISQTASTGDVSLLNASGNRIAIQALDDGSHVVSAFRSIPDLNTTTWQLSLPAVQLADASQTAAFTTTLKEIVTPTSIAGPLPGQTPTTTVMAAACEASFAAF